ncbi:uncharacterized protein M421DRAFT_8871 [Didymella exigua CBS 183.55]|uniref:Uncharacterized protein n=1 Tax=Didymella exigua CBS 183.55 TaxID=1150837 RepID=A0A6A5R876_9PLEO|nr:uncharacterized protein M421DRAFT_8871 [Didymella exigua CBS 183.55]KAF1924395.1 hypothetical protein M421DRAFT_8871 [Didymella exigua CBS 183.55]
MELPRYTTAEKGKGKAQEPIDEPQAFSTRRLSLPIYTGSVPSPPTSPFQGARLPMNRRFPVRPTFPSPSSLPEADGERSPILRARPCQVLAPSGWRLLSAFEQVPAPSQLVTKATGSTESITEAMIKDFKYDPTDKTPPKRRIKPMAEAVKPAVEGNAGPSSISTSEHQPVAHIAAPESRAYIEQQRAQKELDQVWAHAGLEMGGSSRSAHIPAVTTRLAEIEGSLINNIAMLKAAYDSVDAVYGRTAFTTGHSPQTDRTDLGEEDKDEDNSSDGYGPVVSFLNIDAQRRFEESRRLTVLSEHTEPSSGHEDDVWSLAGSSSRFRMDQPNLSALNIVEPGVWMDQRNPRKGACSPFTEVQDPFRDGDGEAGPSRMAVGSFFPAEVFESRPHPEGTLPARSNGSSVSSSCLHSCPAVVSTDPQPRSPPTPPAPAVITARSRSSVHLSPIQEVDSSRDLLSTSSGASPPLPMQTESEKLPSVSPSVASLPSVSSSSTGWVSRCCSIVRYILAWAVPLAFLAVALGNMAITRTFNEVPQDLFTVESKTLHSEHGSGNLTMVWMNGHAVGFNVSAIVNTTLDAGQKSWSFLLDWRADGDWLSADAGAASGMATAMPLPAFAEEFIRNMGFLGLFVAIYWLVSFLSGSVSAWWHLREDDNIFWTRTLLRWFDKGRTWADLFVTAVLSATTWAAASRALLLMPA